MKKMVIAALALALTCSVAAVGAERQVVVNGVRLDPAQLAQLDALAGVPVQDGSYWLDLDTGVWGYADDPTPRGRLGAGTQGGYSSGDGYFSERGAEGEGWIQEGDETDWSGFRIQE